MPVLYQDGFGGVALLNRRVTVALFDRRLQVWWGFSNLCWRSWDDQK